MGLSLLLNPGAILKQSLRASIGNCSRHGSTSCISAVVHSRDIQSIHGHNRDQRSWLLLRLHSLGQKERQGARFALSAFLYHSSCQALLLQNRQLRPDQVGNFITAYVKNAVRHPATGTKNQTVPTMAEVRPL